MVAAVLGIFCVVLLVTCLLLYRSLTKHKELYHTLKQENSFFEELFYAIPIAIFYKKGSIEEGNKAFHHAFGPFKKEVFSQIQNIPKNSEQTLELTYDNNIKKNSLTLYTNLLDSNHNIIGIVGAIWDIHEWNKSKESLLVQKQRLELAFEGSEDGLWDWNLENDILFFSSRWKKIMGYEPQDNPNTLASWLNLVHPKDMAVVNEALSVHLDGRSPSFFIEHRIRDSEPIIWVAVRGKVVCGKENKPLRMSGTIRDITARKEQEEKIRLYKELFILFVSHLPTLAYIKDSQGRFIYLNDFGQKLIGFKTWRNKTVHELFDERTAQELSTCDRLSMYEGIVKQTFHIGKEDGSRAYFEAFTFIIENEEEEKLYCGIGINKSFKE